MNLELEQKSSISLLPCGEHDCCVPISKDAGVLGVQREKRKLDMRSKKKDSEEPGCIRTCSLL